jgi:alpha-mannosidase
MRKGFIKFVYCLCLCLFSASFLKAQTAYFVDGYHGGKWGHYPPQYTSFIVEQLQRNPDWKLNLEIEPETWEWVKAVDHDGYNKLVSLMADQSPSSRIEYVNPSYGQPYMYNISGESIIRQFSYGMELLRHHFPNIRFETYSSEEPCFTSALPQILKGCGFKYASLKNPNTCWGGYVRAYGKEMVDWIGPDGTGIPTVPRYAMETLKPGSTWETIASYNSRSFITKALATGIEHPLGMCLQDAGWKNGPWLGVSKGDYHPTQYVTWRHYFENISTRRDLEKWRLSQEDIQVSLVWGAQVLQRIAQQVRKAENKLLMAEKWAAMDRALYGTVWPNAAFKSAWHSLLLAQHHDCWIVPYNKVDSLNWAGKVRQWTNTTQEVADKVMSANTTHSNSIPSTLKVRNVLPYERNELVDYDFTGSDPDTTLAVLDAQGYPVPTQWSLEEGGRHLLFKARVPAMGEAMYRLGKRTATRKPFAQVKREGDKLIIETDQHLMHLDVRLGGVISSLKWKDRPDKEWVDTSLNKGFNELRGFFYEENRFYSSAENRAEVTILEQGEVRLKIKVKGAIAGHPFTQFICLIKGDPRIDFQLIIDWKGQAQIGHFNDEQVRLENRKKAFYNDYYKLLLLFPAKLDEQHIARNAPFDVTESRLESTFFDSWDSIKNNVVLDWVDVTDGAKQRGLALFSDHTTSYAHSKQHPLALNVQYIGKGLWGRNYEVDGPTRLRYSLLPHEGDWAKAQLWYANDVIANPLTALAWDEKQLAKGGSLVAFSKPGYELSALQYDGKDLLLRVFNAASDEKPLEINLGLPIVNAQMEDLNKNIMEELKVGRAGNSAKLTVGMPRFGFRTLRIKIK